MPIPKNIKKYLEQVRLPEPDSHKGQNGKLLIIGGSQLFHAASKWSLDVASKFVDMVFYASVPENNQLVKEAKKNFWNGIVVPRDDLTDYLVEADCILIGPGMERNAETAKFVNLLVEKYPDKKWVIDAGALQVIEPSLLREHYIITPHLRELEMLAKNASYEGDLTVEKNVSKLREKLHQVTILLKGSADQVFTDNHMIKIEGGNAGMTKGGTGDVLAGLVAALYCTQAIEVSAVVGSYVNKKAGEVLYLEFGPYFNASNLVDAVPQSLWKLLKK